jgi:DNA-binding LacI/PurR family transcriptional regulator
MATLRDVARLAGVSPATASRALAQPDKVSAERRASVQRAATELGYQGASGATTSGQRCLGLIVPDMENPFFAGVAKAVQRRARTAGLAVLVADTEQDPGLEADAVRQMGPLVEGIVLCSPRMPDQDLAALPDRPEILLVNRESAHLRSVVIDNPDGMRQALRHLHALGHRRVAYAGGLSSSWSDDERRRGLELAQLELPEVDVVQLGHFTAEFVGGVAAADLALASGATAVLAHNDLVALGILDRLRSRGVDVPRQMSVVGFDDVPAATQVSPAVTTVAAPLALLGRTAVDRLLDRADGSGSAPARSHRLPVALVVRDSTGPAPVTATSREGTLA